MENEKRLIDANACPCVKCDRLGSCRPGLCEAFAEWWLSPVDAVEVVHGFTLIAEEPKKVLLDRKCEICDQLMLATDNYCPMCGAKNEGEKI